MESRPTTNGIHRQLFYSCDLDLDPMTLIYQYHRSMTTEIFRRCKRIPK